MRRSLTILALIALTFHCQAGFGQTRFGSAIADGEFEGLVVSGTGAQRIITRFRTSSDGTITGGYTLTEDANTKTEGTLNRCNEPAESQLVCRWHDKYGDGVVQLFFTPDFKEFAGRWADNTRTGNWLPWSGRIMPGMRT